MITKSHKNEVPNSHDSPRISQRKFNLISPMFVVYLLLLLGGQGEATSEVSEGSPPDSQDTCYALKLAAQQIRREGYTAIDKADFIREQAYRLKDEAYEVRESAMEARSALETTLVETIALVRSQSTVTNLYIQEIRSTLSDIKKKMEDMEERMENMEEKMEEQDKKEEDRFAALDEHSKTVERKISEHAAVSSSISSHVSETLSTAITLKERQKAQMSEVRIISLYKIAEQTNPHLGATYDADLAVDGMVTFDRHHWADMAAYTHTTGAPGSKILIKLGGLFRIYKIKIWNLRHCCKERLIGAHIYADDRLVGTVIRAQGTYDFTIGNEDPVYAKEVTLKQPLGQTLHILELQIWGTGPFLGDDKFD